MTLNKRVVTAVVAAVALTVVGGPTMAQAAPAETFNYSDCSSYDGYEYCFEGKGVLKYDETPSGNQGFMIHGSGTVTVKYNGAVVSSGEHRSHYVFRSRDGEPQVEHASSKAEGSFGGESCISNYNVTYANGELRHEVYDETCS